MIRSEYKNSGLTKFGEIRKLTAEETNLLLSKYHYLGPLKKWIVSYGNEEGCCVFAAPNSRKLQENKIKYVELVRMVGVDNHRFAMSSLMAKCIKKFKRNFPQYDIVISYADPLVNHDGKVYLSANWIYIGDTEKDGHPYIFIDGISIHPRTCVHRYGTSSTKKLKEMFGDRYHEEEKCPKKKFIYYLKPLLSSSQL